MAAYYQVKLKIKTEDEKGKIKTHTELVLAADETPEGAAYKAREYYGTSMIDYTVEAVTETKILAVID